MLRSQAMVGGAQNITANDGYAQRTRQESRCSRWVPHKKLQALCCSALIISLSACIVKARVCVEF